MKVWKKQENLRNIDRVSTSYSNSAEKMSKEMSAERGVNEELYKKDSLEWILKTEKIQEEIHEKLKNEIQE